MLFCFVQIKGSNLFGPFFITQRLETKELCLI